MVIGYYLENQSSEEESLKSRCIVVFENSSKNGKKVWIEGYNVIHGHFDIKDKNYLLNCKEITKKEYIKITGGYYTPEEYLKGEK